MTKWLTVSRHSARSRLCFRVFAVLAAVLHRIGQPTPAAMMTSGTGAVRVR
jgi:RES domain-containing protein